MEAITQVFPVELDPQILQREPEPALCKDCGEQGVYTRELYLWVEGRVAFGFDDLPLRRCAKGHEWLEQDVLEAALEAIRAKVEAYDIEKLFNIRLSNRSPFS